jgi:group I intron endonuclease
MQAEKQFNFVYITTNLINGKQYVGDHTTNDLEKDMYLGSGRPYFQRALKEYGKENFKREILEFFNTKQEAFNAQEKYIKQYNTLAPNGYNISPTGGLGCRGKHSEESKRKMSINISIALKGKKRSEEQNKKQSLRMLNHAVSLETRKKIGNANKISLKGKRQTPEHIENSAKTRRGKSRSQETKEKISKTEKGKIVSNETKEKISKSHKGKKHSEERNKKQSLRMLGENNTAAKLTNIQVKQIKSFLINKCYTVKQLAKIYNVSISTIYRYKYQL